MPGSILFCFLTAYLLRDRRTWAFRGTLAAGVLMVIALIITLTVNVPIDNLIKGWTIQTLPSDWEGVRNHWETFHCVRTWTSIAGFAAVVSGTLAD